MMLRYFAHAGELHETMSQSAIHTLFSKWYLALFFLAVLLMSIGKVTYIISRKSLPAVYVVIMFTLLVVGLLGYRLSSILSVVAISAGFAMSLMQMIAGILEEKR